MKKDKENKILLLGDTHGRWDHMNQIINKQKPTMILQVGDFGFWPNYHNFDNNYIKGEIKNHDIPIYWCDGNHEDHISIRKAIGDKGYLEVSPYVYYMKRGTIQELPDGRKILWLGGAWSVDWQHRMDGKDWFREEELLTERDISRVFDMKQGEIDIVISHTCPNEFIMGYGDEHFDPSRKVLSFVLNHIRPKRWYFGHWHSIRGGVHKFNDVEVCLWQCLNTTMEMGCWRWLENE
jgi:hypothetical protein